MAVSDPALLEKPRNVVTDEVQLSEPTFHHRVEEGEPRWRLWGRRRPRGALWDHQLVTPRPTGPSALRENLFFSGGENETPGGGESILCLLSQVFSQVFFVRCLGNNGPFISNPDALWHVGWGGEVPRPSLTERVHTALGPWALRSPEKGQAGQVGGARE